jgi:hypothetical protein
MDVDAYVADRGLPSYVSLGTSEHVVELHDIEVPSFAIDQEVWTLRVTASLFDYTAELLDYE